MTALYITLAALAGLVLGWILASLRNRGADSGVEDELRKQISEKDSQLSEARNRENILIAEKSSAAAERDAAKALFENQKEAFKVMSAEALEQNRKQLVNQNLESLLQRQEAIKTMLTPLEEQLKTYQQRLQQSETAQSTTLGEVKQKLETLTQRSESLAKETEQFRMVLKSNQARGRWGEETLRRVVEAAGMSAHCDFTEQVVEGDAKPDMLVHLPGDRVIIVDAKTPDLDFLSDLETTDPEKRKAVLEEHANKLKGTIKALADRDYPAQFPNALKQVVLFLPAESLYSTALEGAHDLFPMAAKRKIMLATPATLIGLLHAISMSWDQQKQTENSQAIAAEAQKLYERVVVFMDHFGRIGEGLAKAGAAFNQAASSYESRVRPSGERLAELGVSTGGKGLPDLKPVESSLRLPADPGA